MNKKAIMGIGTLIIFIATILVAAVAAGVIISTSGVLQQKALLVAEQTRYRLVNGVQITHVFMEGDLTNKTANNVEILARPEAASGPINFKTTSLSFFTDTGAYSGTLSHPEMVETELSPPAELTDSFQAFGDLDGDGLSDQARLELGAGNDYIRVNLTETGYSDQLPLNRDVDTSGVNFSRVDLPIYVNNTVGGYIQLDGVTTTNSEIDASIVTFTDEIMGDCTFAKLRPETRFCVLTLTGTDDAMLEYGETVFIYFKLKPNHVLAENDEFEIKLFPQDGRSTYILDRVPAAIYKVRMNIYP